MGGLIFGIAAVVCAVSSVAIHLNSGWRSGTPALAWVAGAFAMIFTLMSGLMLSGYQPPTYGATDTQALIQACAVKPDCSMDRLMDRLEGKVKNGN